MTLLSRYLLKEFLRVFLAALFGILTVYLCVEFLQKADDLIKYKATITQVAAYFLYGIPAMATQALPIAALIATLISLGNLSRHNEIIAMRAGGLSLAGIVIPVMIGGILVSAVGFINNEFIMPAYSAQANHIRYVEIEKKTQRAVFQQRQLWLRGPDNSIANIGLVVSERDRYELIGVNIYVLNADYTIRERITAERLVWRDGAWRLKNSRKYITAGDAIVMQPADGEIYNVVESPNDMGMIVKRSEEMNFGELWDYVRRLKTSGYKAGRYEVDLYGKLAFPLSSLLMVMIATPLSIQRVRSGGTGKGFALAVLIAAVYWALMSAGRALGKSGALPPLEAAWLANVVFGIGSIIILVRMQRRN